MAGFLPLFVHQLMKLYVTVFRARGTVLRARIYCRRVLQAGDIISVDVTVFKDGFHGDTCKTFLVESESEKVDEIGRNLVEAAYEATLKGTEACFPGKSLNEVGKAIERQVHARGFSISKDFCGHGIGSDFHELPYVYHFDTGKNSMTLTPGQIFTIEPILCEFSPKSKLSRDGWTCSTRDKGRSAQFEHTVLITETGYEVLT
jgi:methionyl aminopeptidase